MKQKFCNVIDNCSELAVGVSYDKVLRYSPHPINNTCRNEMNDKKGTIVTLLIAEELHFRNMLVFEHLR